MRKGCGGGCKIYRAVVGRVSVFYLFYCMPGQKTFSFLLFIFGMAYQLPAQRAKYAVVTPGYDVRIPERTGNNIHIWVASAEQSYLRSSNTTLILNVFSPGMQLVAERKVRLGSVKAWNIDFKYTDSGYFAHIFFQAETANRIILEVDHAGNIRDATSKITGVWARPDSARQQNRVFAMVTTPKTVFFIKTDNEDSTGGKDAGNYQFLNGEVHPPGKNIQTVTIEKVNIKTRQESLQTYASSYLNFSYPFIQLSDTGIIGFAFAAPMVRNDRNNPYYKSSFIMLATLDSNANQSGRQASLLKIGNARGSELYAPVYLFPLHHRLYLINTGWDPYEYRPPPVMQPGFRGFIPTRTTIPLVNSLRIIGIDEKNLSLKDTIFQNQNREQVNWTDRFVTASDISIDLFFSIRYRGNKTGIAHISISSMGDIQEEDMIVDLHYEYLLSRAKRSTDGTLVVPYQRNGRTMGILKIAYLPDASLQ